jgi:hypothetical protein
MRIKVDFAASDVLDVLYLLRDCASEWDEVQGFLESG